MEAHAMLGDTAPAIHSANDILPHLENLCLNGSLRTAHALNAVATVLTKIEAFDKARAFFLGSLAIRDRLDPTSIETQLYRIELAECLANNGEVATSIKEANQAMSMLPLEHNLAKRAKLLIEKLSAVAP
jgi:hypothetical protein